MFRALCVLSRPSAFPPYALDTLFPTPCPAPLQCALQRSLIAINWRANTFNHVPSELSIVQRWRTDTCLPFSCKLCNVVTGKEPRLWNCPKSSCHGAFPNTRNPLEPSRVKNSLFFRGTRRVVLLSSRAWKDINSWALEIGISCTYSNPVVTGGEKHTHPCHNTPHNTHLTTTSPHLPPPPPSPPPLQKMTSTSKVSNDNISGDKDARAPNFVDATRDIQNWASRHIGMAVMENSATASSLKWWMCEDNNNNNNNGYGGGYGDGRTVQTSETRTICWWRWCVNEGDNDDDDAWTLMTKERGGNIIPPGDAAQRNGFQQQRWWGIGQWWRRIQKFWTRGWRASIDGQQRGWLSRKANRGSMAMGWGRGGIEFFGFFFLQSIPFFMNF